MYFKSFASFIGVFCCLNCIAQSIQPAADTSICQGDNLLLTAPLGSAFKWFKNGTVINGAIAKSYTVTDSGRYSVEVVNGNSAVVTPDVKVGINPLPAVDFVIVGGATPCINSPVYFTNTTKGGVDFLWNFNDPKSVSDSTSTNENTTHIFVGKQVANEVFAVKLTVTDTNGCTASAVKTLTIRKPDTRLDEGGSTIFNNELYFTRCVTLPSEFQFSYPGTTPPNSQYQINWGDGTADYSSASINTVLHTYNPGLYNLQFKVTNSGCTDSAIYKVFIGSNPGGSISNPSSTQGCTGDVFSFPFANTQNNPEGTIYTVWINDGTKPDTFVHPPPVMYTHTFNKPSCSVGSSNFLTLSYRISNPCGFVDGTTGGIGISQKPAPDFVINPKDTTCVNTNVSLVNKSPLLYSVSTNGSCSTGKVIWSISPEVGWVLTSGNLGNSSGLNVINWLSGTDMVNVKFTIPGTYTVTLKLGGILCGIESIIKTICVNPAPVVDFSVDTTMGCGPLVVKTTTTSNAPLCGQYTYKWTSDYTPAAGCLPNTPGLSYLQSTSDTSRQPVFLLTNPGIYTLKLVAIAPASACTSLVAQKQVTVKGKPTVTSIGNLAAICVGQKINPVPVINCYVAADTSYAWTFAGGSPAAAAIKNPGDVVYSNVGTFAVSLKATNTCGDTTIIKQLVVNAIPDLIIPKDTAVCAGTATGPFAFTSTLAGSSFSWKNSNTTIGLGASGTGNITGFTAANNTATPKTAVITVTVTKNGCVTQSQFVITVNPKPAAPLVVTPVNICQSDTSPALQVAIAADNNALWYQAATGGTGSGIQPAIATLVPGTKYNYVSQVSPYGCESNRSSIQVVIKPQPQITSATFISPATCGSSTGTITLNGLLPNAAYLVKYQKNGGSPVSFNEATNTNGVLVIQNLAAGTYTAVSVSFNGCTSAEQGPFNLTDPNPPLPPVATGNGPLCSGYQISLQAKAVSAGMATYTWSGPNGFSSQLQNPVLTSTMASAGKYFVTNTINNCTSAPDSVLMIVNATPSVPVILGSQQYCEGDTIKLSGTSNAVNIKWSWLGPNGFIDSAQNIVIPAASMARSGNYRLMVINAAGNCLSPAASLAVTVKPVPKIGAVTLKDPQTCGSSTGIIMLRAQQPNTAYTVRYQKGSANPLTIIVTSTATGDVNISGLSAGVYNNIQLTLNGCPSNIAGPIVLSDPNAPPPPKASANSPICSGDTLALRATSAAAGAYKYNWSGPNGYSSLLQNPVLAASAAAAGKYFVTNTLNNCTSAADSVLVVVHPTPPAPVITGGLVYCEGDTLRLFGNNDTSSVGWLWTGPGGFKDTSQNLVIASAIPLHSGLYRLMAIDPAGNCSSAAASVAVTIKPVPKITGTIIKDPATCGSETGSITIKGQQPNISYTVRYQAGSASTSTLTVTSGSDGDVVIGGLKAGTYNNIQVAVDGCFSNAAGPFVLSDPNAPASPVATGNGPLCSGDSIRLNAFSTSAGALTYNWSGPNSFSSQQQNPVLPATDAASGDYYVTITVNNCTSDAAAVPVAVNTTPPAPLITGSAVYCQGDTVKLFGNSTAGNVNWLWSGPNGFTGTVQNPVIPAASTQLSGDYRLVVINAAGNCTSAEGAINILVKPVPVIGQTTFSHPATCGSTSGAITLAGLSKNTAYTVQYINGQQNQVTFSALSDSLGKVVIGNLSAGRYSDVRVSLNGCSSNKAGPFLLSDPNAPAAPKISANGPLCSGDSLLLTAISTLTGDKNFLWSGPNGFSSTMQNPVINAVSSLATGRYYVTVTTSDCTSRPDSVDVVVHTRPSVPVVLFSSQVCSSDTLRLEASSVASQPVFYNWTGPKGLSATGTKLTIAKADTTMSGIYQVVASVSGCPAVSPGYAQIVVRQKPIIQSVDIVDPASCGSFSGSITLKGLRPGSNYILRYDFNGAQAAIANIVTNPAGAFVLQNLPAGIYNNISVSFDGCWSDNAGPFTLTASPLLVPKITSNEPLCIGSVLSLSAYVPIQGPVSFNWYGPDGFTSTLQNPSIANTSIKNNGTYTVTATLNGCSASAVADIKIAPLSVGGYTVSDTTVCLGINTGTIHLNGNIGSVTRWQASVNQGAQWSNINSASSFLTYNNLTATTWYRAVVQSGLCPAAFSDPAVVTVIAKVDDAFAGNDQIICNSVTATLSAANPVIGKGKWSQVSGPPAILADSFSATSIVNGLQPGITYRFVWTISGAAGCGSTADEVQIVNRPPVTRANAGDDIGLCNFSGNATLALSANRDAGRPYEKGTWKIVQQPAPGSGAISNPGDPNALLLYNKPGKYLLTWTIASDVQNGCGQSTDSVSITISPKPVAQFKLQSLNPCTGNKVETTNSSLNAENYAWYWGDGDSSLFENGSHTYALTGTYTIALIARKFDLSATCTDTAKQSISVIKNLQARIKVDSASRCLPYNLQVSAGDTAGISSIAWRFFDSSTPGSSYYAAGPSASYYYKTAGTDSVRLIVRNVKGCVDSVVYRFTVYDVPSATITPGSIKTCEQDTIITFTGAVTYAGADAVNYRWLVNNQVRGVTNPFNYRFMTPASQTGNTNYTIQLLAQNAGGCGDTSRAASVVVMPIPPAGIKVLPSIIQQQPDYTFTFQDTASASSAINYLWLLGDRSMQTRNGKQVTFQYSDTGTYHIKLVATDFANGCVNSDTAHVTILYVPGYIQVPNAICPGCTNNDLRRFLPLGKGLSHYRLRILTTWGKVIFETTQLNPDGSPKEAWDGKYNGTPADQGVYRWEIEGRYINGTEWRGMLYPGSAKPVKTGFLTIIK